MKKVRGFMAVLGLMVVLLLTQAGCQGEEEGTSGQNGSASMAQTSAPIQIQSGDLTVTAYPEPAQAEVASDAAPLLPVGWSTIMMETFESGFPAGLWDIQGDGGPYWDDVTYRFSNGSKSAYCVAAGPGAITPPGNYPTNVDSWMIWGPFSLSSATDAELSFALWLNCETNHDWVIWAASTNGVNFFGYTQWGNSGGWVYKNFDLTTVPSLGDVTGGNTVYIALVFQSDESLNYEGAYVDDIILSQNVAYSCKKGPPVGKCGNDVVQSTGGAPAVLHKACSRRQVCVASRHTCKKSAACQ